MEELKDLGGLVNKDLAFSKLPQGAVFDSQNFRITTDDGNTTAARENIKGTVEVTGFQASPCIKNITFDTTLVNALFIPGQSYDITTQLDVAFLALFTTTYSSLANLVIDYAAHLAAQPQIINENITVTVSASNVITFIMPNCNTITITNINNSGRPNTVQDYPYQLFDPGFNVENYLGDSYNSFGNFGGGPAPIWSWGNNLGAAPLNITSQMFSGVTNYAGNLVAGSSGLQVLQYGGNSSGFTTETYFIGDAAYLSNIATTSPSLFDYFPDGPYQIDFDFYVAKTSNCEVKIRLLLDVGAGLNLPLPAGLNSVTIPSYTNYPLLQLGGDIDLPAGTTDFNYLSSIGGSSAGFTFTIPGGLSIKDLVNPAVSYNWGFVIQVITTNNAVPPPSYNFNIYFDRFSFRGLPINLTSVATTNTVANSIGAGLIIGWTALRDDIYLFTTDGVFDPDDPTTWGGPTPPVTTGQIWKFSYDKGGNYASSFNYNLSLVYSNNLNFTTCRPIANPGMIESRYESPIIQKIYWTDNYNPPRQINVADPNVANLTVEDLNLQASLSMDLPVVTEVMDGGALMVGVYQVAYRLKNVNGSESRFSRTSQLIPIIDAQESTVDIRTYYPGKDVRDNANKSIRVVVDNIDPTYNTIEFATLYYFDATSEPEISVVKETAISNINPNTGLAKVELTITGAEVAVPITVDEFTAFNTVIKRAKTLAAKKQTLFVGNVTIGEQVVDWDARAYRFPANQTRTFVEDVQGAFTSIDYVAATNSFEYNGVAGSVVPEQADCIQQYNFQSPNVVTTPNAYLYQPGTTILGGKGPNVTYEFVTQIIKLDNKNDPGGSTGVGGPHMTPDNNWIITLNTIDRQFTADGVSLSNNGSPYVYDLFVGYRRDEMYRFGIVFYDELDNPTYVNWIADIRMPHAYMPNNAQGDFAGTSVPAFPGNGTNRSRIGSTSLSSSFSSDPIYYDTTTDDLWGRPLGIKFTIDFSSVPAKYKRASIVRTALKENEKHVLAQGLFLPTYTYENVVPGPVMSGPYSDTTTIFTEYGTSGSNRADFTNTGGAGSGNNTWFDAWTFRSPEFLFKAFPGLSGSNYIDIVNLLDPSDRDFLMVRQSGLGTGGYFIADTTGVDFNGSDQKYWTAKRSKYYKSTETASIPNSLKNNATSQNPYPILGAFSYSSGGTARAYVKGSSVPSSLPGGPVLRSVHSCNPRDINGPAGGGNNYPTVAFSYGNNAVFVQLETGAAVNWNYGAFGNQYPRLDTWETVGVNLNYKQYLANYKRNVPAPFGGQGYFARSNSEYIPCNNLIDIRNKTIPKETIVFGGDTAVAVLDYTLQFFDRGEGAKYGSNSVNLLLHMAYIPVETSIAVDYRRSYNNSKVNNDLSAVTNRVDNLDYRYDNNSVNWYTGQPKIAVEEIFNVDPVFNHTDKSVYRYFAKPTTPLPDTYDCRVWRSEKKIDGELIESWSVFKPSAYLDVESAYGPLNNLVVFQDKLYFIQDRGFGVLQVAEQKLISDAAGTADLVLGSSGILERYDYISTKTGTKHQFSMSVSDYSMIWFDTLARKMYRYKPGAMEPLSDIKGYSAFVYNNTGGAIQNRDNPYYMDPTNPIVAYTWLGTGIHSTYDFRHQEFYMTFLNADTNLTTTLVYNDIFDGYVGKYSFHPKVYINDKVNIFAPWLDNLGVPSQNPVPLESIHILNYGPYGRFFNNQFADASYLSFVVNSNPTLEKTFTNLEIVAEAYKLNTYNPQVNPSLTQYNALAEIDYQDFFEQMRVFNNYQNTNWQFLNTSSRRHKTIWNLKVLSDRVLDVNSNIFDSANLDPNRPRITRRLKDKWFVVELRYNNTPNNRFVVHTAKAIYSANSR